MSEYTQISVVVVTHLARTQKQFLAHTYSDLRLMFVDVQEAVKASKYACDFLIVHDTDLSRHNLSLRNKAHAVIYVPSVHGGNNFHNLVDVLASLRDSVDTSADPTDGPSVAPVRLDAIQVALGDIAQGFLKAPSWHQYINSALKKLGLATGVHRVYLFENVNEEGALRFYQRYEWAQSYVTPQIDNPDLQGGDYTGYERWVDNLSNNRPIVGDVDTFPESERQTLEAQGIQSICVMPVIVEGEFWGFIGFDSVVQKRVWTSIELETLRLVANVLAAAIQYERAASALERTETELNNILNRVDDVIYALDLENGSTIYLNRAIECLTGYPLQQFYQNPKLWKAVVHEQDRDSANSAYQQLLEEEGDHYTFQYRIVRQDGQIRWVEDRVYVVYRDSQPVQINGILVDITADKTAQQQAEQVTLRLNTVLDNIKSAVLLVSADGKIIRINRAFIDGLGKDEPETFAELLDQFAEVVTHPEEMRHHAVTAMQEQRVLKQYELTLKDGRVMSCDYNPIVHGNCVEHLWHCRDITVYKQAMSELQLALEREVQLNRLRNDFISMVSHEFRTPLSIINSSNETLMRYDNRLSEEQKIRRHLKIETQVRHMTAMLDDALSLGKTESSFIFSPVQTDIASMVNEILSDFRQTHQSYRLVFNDQRRKCEAEVDPKMFRQIIHNLLSNAIKYSEEGSQVTVDLDCAGAEIVLSVADEGIGIPSSEHDRMFQMFRRGSNVQNIPGSGLGLVVVNNAVQRHNGSITFESEVNRGTRFVIRLPIQQSLIIDPMHAEVAHDSNSRDRRRI